MADKKKSGASRGKKAAKGREGGRTSVTKKAALESLRGARQRFLERIESRLVTSPEVEVSTAEVERQRKELVAHLRERIDRRKTAREEIAARIEKEIAHDERLVKELEAQTKLEAKAKRRPGRRGPAKKKSPS
jgi:HD superfamily phosphohydrolase